MKVYALPAGESWIVDRMVSEWNEENKDISVPTLEEAKTVWLIADWRYDWISANFKSLKKKKVVTTVHHIVPEKWSSNKSEQENFKMRDSITDIYHVFNEHTQDFIRPLTNKPIKLIPYWANDKIWKADGDRRLLRFKHKLPGNHVYLLGSFQRDTEGAGIQSGVFLPKLEKGPDLFVDAVIKYRDQHLASASGMRVEVVLAGWRRQYVMKRLDEAGIKHYYFELPSQETLNELYQTLDVYLVTSRCEGGPQALIECALTKTHVVSRNVGIAKQVFPPWSTAIRDDVTKAMPAIPNVDAWRINNEEKLGFKAYRELFQSL
jgi:glycosyltransferase involved in cell wall biosynthesis